MASPIEDVTSLPGRQVFDQEGEELGEIKEVYGLGEDPEPMWVTIESSSGEGESKCLFVPMARLREKDGDLSVPYSMEHVQDAPEVEVEDEVSEEDDRKLRDYYAIDLADQEFRTDGNKSYAAQVPKGDGQARKITDELDSKSSGDSGEPGGTKEGGESGGAAEPESRAS